MFILIVAYNIREKYLIQQALVVVFAQIKNLLVVLLLMKVLESHQGMPQQEDYIL